MDQIPIRSLKPTTPHVEATYFNIKDLKSLLGGNDLFHALHRHDFYFMLVIENGKGIHEIDFNSYQIQHSSIYFLRPGQVHQLQLDRKSAGFIIQFNNEFLSTDDSSFSQLIKEIKHNNLYSFEKEPFNGLMNLFYSIYHENSKKRYQFLNVIRANLRILFIELIRNNTKTPSHQKNEYQQERLDTFLELLEKHIINHKQVSHYAEMLHLSVYQLNAITTKTLGKTSSTLINEQIILESKRLLLATNNQVNQIALQLGYVDVSYFIRFFKKHTGFSPEVFRNNSK
ncbi:helix-turn-helix domain-containing protein [Chondrinema litorale]|uniref:helix-turn-helix domain-containing protein n=1 Tax=Chondrinema litorale TaxID=2994555 RepID=UPI002543BF59|nr:AraC family transcriptional regulator [Chondrinema litorale]UZR96896.1 AraC family transcriptional regulator [Chondrinema litorale]